MQFDHQPVAPPNLAQIIHLFPLTINPDAYVVDAIKLMHDQQTKINSYILVVQGTHLLGIITTNPSC